MRFTVDLRPRAAPRPRSKAGQGAYYPKEYQRWREAAAWLVREIISKTAGPRRDRFAGPVSISIVLGADSFEVEIAEVDDARPGRLTGDVDNYAKAIVDALQEAGLISNDRQVQRLEVAFRKE